jgi:hypothetical protein
MTVENGGEQPANDTALTQAADQTQIQAAENTEAEETEGQEGEEGQEKPADEVEVDYEGEKFKLPTKLKDALLRQADYTRKTQEVAEAKKALEAEREAFKGHTAAEKAHFASATKLAGLDERLGEYAKVDWQTLYATNPDLYQQHRIAYDQLKDHRETAARDFSQKEIERRQTSERENANRVQKVQAEIARLVPDWTPGGELDLKLMNYGTSLNFSKEELGEMAIRNPQFVHQLNRLRIYDEAANKQKTKQTFDQSQAAKPVTRVGGNSGSAARRTTDSSGDALSTEEWVRRERERTQKQVRR